MLPEIAFYNPFTLNYTKFSGYTQVSLVTPNNYGTRNLTPKQIENSNFITALLLQFRQFGISAAWSISSCSCISTPYFK